MFHYTMTLLDVLICVQNINDFICVNSGPRHSPDEFQ